MTDKLIKPLVKVAGITPDEAFNYIRDITIERGGGDGFLQTPRLPPEVVAKVDELIYRCRKNMDPASIELFAYEDDKLNASGSQVVPKLFGTSNDTLKKRHLVRFITGDYQGGCNVGMYLRYAEKPSLCTAATDTYFDMGAYAKPADHGKIANGEIQNRIKLGDELYIYADEAVGNGLPAHIIHKIMKYERVGQSFRNLFKGLQKIGWL